MTGYHVKDLFFDRKKILDAMDRASRKALSQAGAFVRTKARSSMRRRKGPSKPGQPPSVHEGSLKNKLFFSYDTSRKSVVVGPVKYKKGAVPRLMEEGGTERVIRKGVSKDVKIAARPYMGPARDAELPKLADRWANSIKA